MIRLCLQGIISIIGGAKMTKTYIIEEKFVGYADITIEAETEEEAIQIYKDGNYKDCNYNLDEYFYEYEFNSIREEKE